MEFFQFFSFGAFAGGNTVVRVSSLPPFSRRALEVYLFFPFHVGE